MENKKKKKVKKMLTPIKWSRSTVIDWKKLALPETPKTRKADIQKIMMEMRYGRSTTVGDK